MKRLGLALCSLTLIVTTAAAGDDAIDEALALEGLVRSDLGFEPRGWWSRYPADIPYRMRHFDDLMAEPLATVTFARTASAVARDRLSREALAKVPEKSDGPLYQAAHMLGVERKFGGFRSYSANLEAKPTELVDALMTLLESAGRKTTFHTFGNDSPYPNRRAEFEAMTADVPAAAREPLGRLILNLLDAHAWVERAFRRVPPAARLAVQRRLDLSEELTDALEYFPALDDVQATVDEASLWYGGLKTVAALELARHELADVVDAPAFRFDWHGPLGWVRIHGGGQDALNGDDAFLVVDLGGDDLHSGATAAPVPGRSLAAVLDLGGDDVYIAGETAAQGAGLAAVGVLLDVAGNDRYHAIQCAQGFGQIGFGLLADLDGDDSYVARYAGQGAAILGVGLLLEAAGADSYSIQSDGQGFGGAGGVGTLADRAGDDRYQAVRDPAVTQRPSYHSEERIAVSNAQGVGIGRRGDGADGHSWAGGLGQLIDVEGNDSYTAGNWAMGTGYWFGTGILHDAAGNDTYRGVVWSQGSGAHFCIGALIDEAGDDRHLVEEDGRSSLAFGHDFTVALLVDIAGDDEYTTTGDGLGYSINRSVAMLLDGAGDDHYTGKQGDRPGFARPDDRFAARNGGYTYFAEAGSIGLFLDADGTDVYDQLAASDGALLLDPEESPNRAARNFSIGVDRSGGRMDFTPATAGAPSLLRRR